MKSLLVFIVFAFTSTGLWANKPISIDSLEKRIQALEMQMNHLNCLAEKCCKDGQMNSFMGKQCMNDEGDEDMFFQKFCGNSPMKQIKIIRNKELHRGNGYEIKTLPLSNKLLVLSPLFLFLIVMIVHCFLLKRSGFSLREALSSKHTDANGQVVLHPSSSKFLAFISILAGLVFAVFIVTFYFYFAFKHCPLPNFIGLWPVVAILGIGILPYIFQSMFKK